MVFLRMTKTLANPLRRPPEHLTSSRSQIRVTTRGRNHKNAELGTDGKKKKIPSVPEGVGEHMEKGVAEPASSFWDAGRRGGGFFLQGKCSVSQPGAEQRLAKPGFSAALSGFGSARNKSGERKTNSASGYVRDQRAAHVLPGVFLPLPGML